MAAAILSRPLDLSIRIISQHTEAGQDPLDGWQPAAGAGRANHSMRLHACVCVRVNRILLSYSRVAAGRPTLAPRPIR
jgi:hypothetical protein